MSIESVEIALRADEQGNGAGPRLERPSIERKGGNISRLNTCDRKHLTVILRSFGLRILLSQMFAFELNEVLFEV